MYYNSKSTTAGKRPYEVEAVNGVTYFAIDDLRGRGADNPIDAEKSADAWHKKRLPVYTPGRLHISGEIGNIGSHRSPTTSHAAHRRDNEPRTGRSGDGRLLFPDSPRPACKLSHANNGTSGSRKDNDRLEHKEPAQFMGGNEQDRKLHTPEEEVGYHLLRSNASGLGQVVRDVEIRGPDSSDHLSHGG